MSKDDVPSQYLLIMIISNEIAFKRINNVDCIRISQISITTNTLPSMVRMVQDSENLKPLRFVHGMMTIKQI